MPVLAWGHHGIVCSHTKDRDKPLCSLYEEHHSETQIYQSPTTTKERFIRSNDIVYPSVAFLYRKVALKSPPAYKLRFEWYITFQCFTVVHYHTIMRTGFNSAIARFEKVF